MLVFEKHKKKLEEKYFIQSMRMEVWIPIY